MESFPVVAFDVFWTQGVQAHPLQKYCSKYSNQLPTVKSQIGNLVHLLCLYLCIYFCSRSIFIICGLWVWTHYLFGSGLFLFRTRVLHTEDSHTHPDGWVLDWYSRLQKCLALIFCLGKLYSSQRSTSWSHGHSPYLLPAAVVLAWLALWTCSKQWLRVDDAHNSSTRLFPWLCIPKKFSFVLEDPFRLEVGGGWLVCLNFF